jgi:hypothetical protein
MSIQIPASELRVGDVVVDGPLRRGRVIRVGRARNGDVGVATDAHPEGRGAILRPDTLVEIEER